MITLHSDNMQATNTLDNPNNVVPKQQTVNADGNRLVVTLPAKTFAVCK